MAGPRVLVVDHDADLAELVRMLLTEAGYEAMATTYQTDVMALVRQQPPDLIMLDLEAGHTECWQVLDGLRTQEAMARIPVLATSVMEAPLNLALTSYTVRQVVLKPFNIDDLLARVRAALEARPVLPLPRPVAVPEPLLTWAADVLQRQARDIVARWAQRLLLRALPGLPGLGLQELLSNVPFMIPLLASVLRYGPGNGREDLWRTAEEHARRRAVRGVPLTTVVQEYQSMAEEIWNALQRAHPVPETSAPALFELSRRLNYTLDQLVLRAVAAYPPPERARRGGAAPSA